jgi:hypothetical protein
MVNVIRLLQYWERTLQIMKGKRKSSSLRSRPWTVNFIGFNLFSVSKCQHVVCIEDQNADNSKITALALGSGDNWPLWL